MLSYPATNCVETAQPTTEPVLLAEAKLHLRCDSADEDNLITALIVAARQYCENISGRTLAQRTFLQQMERFPDNGLDITLRRSPVVSVQSVYYYAKDGTNTLMVSGTDFRLDSQIIPARVRTPLLQMWKETLTANDAVRISYTAGLANAPTAAKQTILLLVGHWFENRESVVVGSTNRAVDCTVTSLMDSYRIMDVAL